MRLLMPSRVEDSRTRVSDRRFRDRLRIPSRVAATNILQLGAELPRHSSEIWPPHGRRAEGTARPVATRAARLALRFSNFQGK